MTHRYLHDQKAGNFHDIWKHFVLSQYFLLRSKQTEEITYIDTHAGAIVYKNDQLEQLKTGLLGIPNGINGLPDSPYKSFLETFGARIMEDEEALTPYLIYPGSLALFSYFMLNKTGKVIGCEINEDVAMKCRKGMALLKRYSKTALEYECIQKDGYAFALNYLDNAALSEQGVVFVDPPYYPSEGEDWENAIKLLKSMITKRSQWTYILWYCIYTDEIKSNKGFYETVQEYLCQQTKTTQSLNLQLQIRPLSSKYAKAITGMIIVNPKINANEFISSIFSSGITEIAELLKHEESHWGPKITVNVMGG